MADLETPDPVTPPEPVAAAEPPPAPDPPADPAEADAIEMPGGKFVPLSAVLAEREKGKSYREKAELYDQTAQYVHQVKPYIDFLQANPDLMTRQTTTHREPVPTEQPVDEQAEYVAKMLDLYTTDGKPDVRRAQMLRQFIDDAADAKAEARTKPMQESSLRERSGHNYQRALLTKAPDGRAPKREVLDALWARTDPSITATEEGASAVVATALGLSLLHGAAGLPTAQPAATPALVTETPGSRTPNRPSLSPLDEKIMGIRNRSADDWGKLTRTFTAGRPNVLED
jgi:hypothetical protein